LAGSTKLITPGVRAMFVSTLAFFLANSCVKQVGHLPALELVFFRCIIATVICTAGLLRARASILGSNHTILLLRGVFGTTALVTFFVTLQHIPLATAQTLQYLAPVFTAIIAIFILNEGLLPAQIVFYAMAFAGVLLIERVDDRISPWYVAIGVFSGFCSGMAYNLVRSMRGKEYPLTIVFHFQAVGAVVGAISLFFEWATPHGWDWLFLVLIGTLSQLGQVFLTRALQSEAVAGVAIINYTGLVYAILVGWFIFGEPQTIWSLLGMLIVVASVLMSITYGRRRQRLAALETTAA
jgi:drug/metabolite transporter (DMT)-like permease